jgi:predicted RNase H-like HicB family nuclease
MKHYKLTAVIWKEGRRYVSKCPELGVASFGATPDKAHAALAEAVNLYLSNAKKLGIWRSIEPALTSESRFTAPLEVAAA